MTVELSVNCSTIWYISKHDIVASVSAALRRKYTYLNGAPVISVQMVLKEEGKVNDVKTLT